MKITLFTAVIEENGQFFTVNGGTRQRYDDAVRIASRHSSVKSGAGKIVRVDEECVQDWELEKRPY